MKLFASILPRKNCGQTPGRQQAATACLLLTALCSLIFSGCSTTAGALEAASTKLEVRNSKSSGMTLVLPKELDSTNLKLELDPKTGHILLTADKLKSSSQAIIESAGASQAASIAAMSKTISDIVPVLAKAAVAAAAPENTVAVEAAAAALP